MILLALGGGLAAQQAAPAGQKPPAPGTAPQAPTGSPQATAAAPAVPRTFAAPVGLLFNTVRPERVADFEKVIAYLQDALMKTTDPTLRAQARGWRVFKATEPGPNSTIVFVFVLDPTVPGAEYGLGRVLADAHPDTAELQEIWKLYTGSITSGGTLMNLSPVSPDPAILTEPRRPAPAAPSPQAPGRDR